MAQFWLGIFIIAIAAILGWCGKQVAEEGWRKWKTPTSIETRQQIPDPIITCRLEYPIISTESPPKINKTNPDAVLCNDGAVSVTSLKVDLWILPFDKKLGIIDGYPGQFGKSPQGHLFAITEFGPSQKENASVPGINASDHIAIYVFDLSYYRAADLKEYRRREMFFTESNFIFTEKEFVNRNEYSITGFSMHGLAGRRT